MSSMKQNCENCKLRAHYEKNPKSILGRFWRWHINFCPGWKAYFTSQSDEKKAELRDKYTFMSENIKQRNENMSKCLIISYLQNNTLVVKLF